MQERQKGSGRFYHLALGKMNRTLSDKQKSYREIQLAFLREKNMIEEHFEIEVELA